MIAWVRWASARNNAGWELWYISELPGEAGVDYGHTDKKAKARYLTERQARAFMKYRFACGDKPGSYGVTK